MRRWNAIFLMMIATPLMGQAQVTIDSPVTEIIEAVKLDLRAHKVDAGAGLALHILDGRDYQVSEAKSQAMIRALILEIEDTSNTSRHRSLAASILAAGGHRDAASPRSNITAALVRLYRSVEDDNVRGTIMTSLGVQADAGLVFGLIAEILAKSTDAMTQPAEGRQAIDAATHLVGWRARLDALLDSGAIRDVSTADYARRRVGG